MELAALVDTLLGIVVSGVAFWAIRMSNEAQRIGILLNRTREEYATKLELRDDTREVRDSLHRLEEKIDRMLEK